MSEPHAPSSEYAAHLSQISTDSGLTGDELCLRYQRPIYRLLCVVVSDPEAAADLTQDILIKLVRGDFGRWEGRGRFRDYLKVVVRHAAIDYLTRDGKIRLIDLNPEAEPKDVLDALWDVEWAREVKILAWHNLRRHQLKLRQVRNQHAGAVNVFYTLLRLRVKHPRARIPELTRRLVRQTRRAYTEANVRQQLARARDKFVELLKQEVLRGLPPDRAAELNQKLLDQNLARYVRKFMRVKQAPPADHDSPSG